MSRLLAKNIPSQKVTSRQAAFLALDLYFLRGVFIAEGLNQFKDELSTRDFSFAYEVASGVVRQKGALDAIAGRVQALPRKRKEKILLRMSLYQLLYLDRVPDFAIGDEMVGLAKKYNSLSFAKYLNAFLRNLAPKCSLDMLSNFEQLSYSEYFIERMIASYGKKQALELLEQCNTKTPLFARDREEMKMISLEGDGFETYINNPRYYIQNPSQFQIYSHLKNALKKHPQAILDLAASPGGKSILLHDFFPNASLFANDVSDKKRDLLQENFTKYAIKATLSVGCGTEFTTDQLFDLIVVDAPCSNSGCLYKCPEARWRLTKEDVAQQVQLQKKLLQSALKHLTPEGVIWYSTCSILPEENEQLIASFPELKVAAEKLILPSKDGCEGGYGACLYKL
jgi:16S rRNA (cytosine967-C5)-methyltransferase